MAKQNFRTMLLAAVASGALAAAAMAQQAPGTPSTGTPSTGGATPVSPTTPPPQRAPGTLQERAVPSFSPVTDQRLANPEPRNWLMYRRTYDGWGYSPLDQINAGNVQELTPAWTFVDRHDRRPPVAADRERRRDVRHDAADQVLALDAKTGDAALALQAGAARRPDPAAPDEPRRGALWRQGLLSPRPTRSSSRSTPRPARWSGDKGRGLQRRATT